MKCLCSDACTKVDVTVMTPEHFFCSCLLYICIRLCSVVSVMEASHCQEVLKLWGFFVRNSDAL